MNTIFNTFRVISLLLLIIEGEGQVFQDRRWTLCETRQAVNTTLETLHVRGLAECVLRCLEIEQCMSGHFCKVGGAKTCSLSIDWPMGQCSDLANDNSCTAFKVSNPCLNNGTLNWHGYNCSCVGDFYDTFCHRYRYDCSEFDESGFVTLQPRGSPTAFFMPCNSGKNVLISIQQVYLQAGEMNRTLIEYEHIFYTDSGSGWTGLHPMFLLTKQGEYSLTVNLNPIVSRVAIYDDFKVQGPQQDYSFSYGSYRSDLSNMPDGLSYSGSSLAPSTSGVNGGGSSGGGMVGQPFSTVDKDPYGCAALYGVGWWYTSTCGPVIPWDPSVQRGKWPRDASVLVNLPWMVFNVELVSYY